MRDQLDLRVIRVRQAQLVQPEPQAQQDQKVIRGLQAQLVQPEPPEQ